MHHTCTQVNTATVDQPEVKEAEPEAGNSEMEKAEEEEIDIDLEDPEVGAAAVKIQATFKGHMARKELKANQVTSCPGCSFQSGW